MICHSSRVLSPSLHAVSHLLRPVSLVRARRRDLPRLMCMSLLGDTPQYEVHFHARQLLRTPVVVRQLGTPVLPYGAHLSDVRVNFALHLSRRHCSRSFCTDTSTQGTSVDEAQLATPAEESVRGAMQSVRIRCGGDIADGLLEALLCFGATSCTVEDAHFGNSNEQEMFSDGPVPWQLGERQLWEECHITAIFPPERDVGESIAMASHSIGYNEMPHYSIELMEDQDWIEQVQNLFEPVEVAADLWILPKWREPPNPFAINVILDPGLAFGTGEHPTTRLCLHLLYQSVKGGERVLDYGTGSGVLSIAALKMGALRAVGVDIDPMAISSARYNASLNDIEDDRMQVFLASMNGGVSVSAEAAFRPVYDDDMDVSEDIGMRADFDIVVANLLLNPLIELADRIVAYARPGAVVGVSGILVEQVEQVRHTYARYLDGIQVIQDSGWVSVSGVRKLPL